MVLAAFASLMLAALPSADAVVKREADAWHAQRLERLRAEDGWLSLVNLVWLDEGDTAIGSSEGSGVMLPPSAPKRLGTLHRKGEEVSFTPAPGVDVVTSEGAPFRGGPLTNVTLRTGSITFQALQRGERIGVRVKDSQSPTRTGFTGIARFEPRMAWRKEARWEPAKEGETIRIPSVIGGEHESPLAGTAHFTHEGKPYQLRATREGDELFFVFGDATNRDLSYGAGRFLYTALPEETPEGPRVVLDFNRAYNPPCAFTPYATCPLPPPGNKLKLRVEAGEQRWEKPGAKSK